MKEGCCVSKPASAMPHGVTSILNELEHKSECDGTGFPGRSGSGVIRPNFFASRARGPCVAGDANLRGRQKPHEGRVPDLGSEVSRSVNGECHTGQNLASTANVPPPRTRPL